MAGAELSAGADARGSVKAGAAGAAEGTAVDKLFAGGRVLSDGAMGTMLYGRGIFINRCFDELNLSQPEVVAGVHAEYLLAGSQIIETNTFGANAYRLDRYGLRDRVRDINLAGVRIARQCVAQIAEKQASEAYVAGAIGPLGVRLEPLGELSKEQARAAFAEQIAALAEGGPGVGADLLVLETMTSLACFSAIWATHWRAMRTPARLISRTRSRSPYRSRRMALAPKVLVSNTSRTVAIGVASKAPTTPIPALLTSTSITPNVEMASAMALLTLPELVTSSGSTLRWSLCEPKISGFG